MSRYSQERLEAKIQEGISMMIVGGEIKHHNLSTLTSVTHVLLSSDNAYATVYVSAPLDDAKVEACVSALMSARSFIQKRLGAFMRTKNTPVLTFKRDIGFQEGEKMDRILASLSKDGN